MLDYLVDGLVIVAVIYGVVTICYWTYKFHQTWQKVKDDEGNLVEAKTALQNKRQDDIAVTEQTFNKEKAND